MLRQWIALSLLLTASFSFTSTNGSDPVNLAPKAKVSANSEYSGDYLARWAVDGKIPGCECKEDRRQAWCLKGWRDDRPGEFTLEWKQPVTVGEIVYFARTGMLVCEGFKDYEVYVNDSAKPVASGTFSKTHGPQRITLPRAVKANKVMLRFLSTYGPRYNPGASEIAVFAQPPSDKYLARMSIPADQRKPESMALRQALLDGKLGFKDVLLIKRHPMHLSHVYVYHVEGYRPGGGLHVWSPDEKGGTFRCLVDSPDGMISTADISYDGKKVVFAWKRGGLVNCRPINLDHDVDRSVVKNNYQIYTVNIDGTDLKQITNDQSNNLDPSWLPDGGITFISDRKPAYAYCYVVTSPVVYRMDADGTNQKRLSANYLMDFTPSVLNDGRIVYTRWEYVDRAACPIQSLWAINPDGTGLTGVYGNRVLWPGTFMDAQPIPESNSIICTATNHNGSCCGGIVLIDPTKGANALEAMTNLTPEIDIFREGGQAGNGLRGPYEKPFAIGGGKFFVSKRGELQLRDFDMNMARLLPVESNGMGYFCAQPVRATTRPPVLTGGPKDNKAILPEDGSVSGAWATVFMQDVYKGLEPHVKRGEIKQIAIVQELEKATHTPQDNYDPVTGRKRKIAAFGFQFPLVSCGATYAAKKLWGLADVKEDGTAIFRVPSEVPIYFMALDAEGRAVQRMRSFTHLMPGEVQGCVGCHADRNSVAPRGGHKLAMRGVPQQLQVPEWGVAGFSYAKVVQPVWDKYCIECHNEREQPGGVDMSGDKTDFFNVSYDHLARKGTLGEKHTQMHNSPLGKAGDALRGESPYTSWIWTINGAGYNTYEIAPRRWGSPASKLAEIIRSGHPDQKGKPRFKMDDNSRRKVFMWIDLNVPYYGTASSNHKSRVGSRRMYPHDLDTTLADVASRRCAECHKQGVPRTFYTRMLKPENNSFLLAPLAKAAGGTEKCGKAIFASRDDPDYQKIYKTFDPLKKLLEERPRADMDGFYLMH